jgi:hypothetical protein
MCLVPRRPGAARASRSRTAQGQCRRGARAVLAPGTAERSYRARLREPCCHRWRGARPDIRSASPREAAQRALHPPPLSRGARASAHVKGPRGHGPPGAMKSQSRRRRQVISEVTRMLRRTASTNTVHDRCHHEHEADSPRATPGAAPRCVRASPRAVSPDRLPKPDPVSCASAIATPVRKREYLQGHPRAA